MEIIIILKEKVVATKKSQTAKPAPKATKTVRTASGKTKTMPAKKPASKPAPKATSTSSAKAAPKHKYTVGAIIASIIGAIAVVALVTIGIVAICNNLSRKNENTLIVENGDGEKVTTKYINFNNDGFRIKIPDALKVADTPENNSKTTSVLGAYVNDSETVSLAVMSNTNGKINNDQIKSHLDSMKEIYQSTGKVISTDYYTKGDYNIGTMRISVSAGNEEVYQDIAIFSQDNALIMVNISYAKDEAHKWEPVNKFIINSIEFLR